MPYDQILLRNSGFAKPRSSSQLSMCDNELLYLILGSSGQSLNQTFLRGKMLYEEQRSCITKKGWGQ